MDTYQIGPIYYYISQKLRLKAENKNSVIIEAHTFKLITIELNALDRRESKFFGIRAFSWINYLISTYNWFFLTEFYKNNFYLYFITKWLPQRYYQRIDHTFKLYSKVLYYESPADK